jgi:hypothetical protein
MRREMRHIMFSLTVRRHRRVSIVNALRTNDELCLETMSGLDSRPLTASGAGSRDNHREIDLRGHK